jgi:hypothetical protein
VVVGSSSLDGSVWYELAVLCCRVLLDFRLACQLCQEISLEDPCPLVGGLLS